MKSGKPGFFILGKLEKYSYRQKNIPKNYRQIWTRWFMMESVETHWNKQEEMT
ncbi:hypothetical protein PPK14_gp25 [Bacillus phage vB_BspS_SplendidRed]|uniref:Uncharacterized protein n=1 Tax=Bacillus phage vB_BspS_SplendidRed TaxID=2591379 RepID=A0A5B9NIJ5_9CAUD|nr:hypothetical protein PPK14_gp25 [Bacillus phage vB_BspS_SplendidRed]QEG13499.1 hypothetical protein SPLENDIDRED_25 [Bacillus phage vB_BspS_SplendidRed]